MARHRPAALRAVELSHCQIGFKSKFKLPLLHRLNEFRYPSHAVSTPLYDSLKLLLSLPKSKFTSSYPEGRPQGPNLMTSIPQTLVNNLSIKSSRL